MKKLLKVLTVASLLLLLNGGNVFAAENEEHNEVNKEEYKEMMTVVKEKVEDNKENEIKGLPEVIDFKEKYTEEQINEFVQNTDAVKNSFVQNSNPEIDLEVEKNEEKIVEFDDGSFVVVKDTTEPVISLTNGIMPYSTGTAGKSYKTNYEQQWWGIYLAMEAHLITYYTLNKTSINIYDTDHAGTKAIFPTTVDNVKTSIVTNKAKTVKSKGNFRKINGVAIGGQAIGFTSYHTLRTTIAISSVSGSTVKYTTKSVTE